MGWLEGGAEDMVDEGVAWRHRRRRQDSLIWLPVLIARHDRRVAQPVGVEPVKRQLTFDCIDFCIAVGGLKADRRTSDSGKRLPKLTSQDCN